MTTSSPYGVRRAGGQIHVEKSLEKLFCHHCGTQLLLKQGADGLLIPMMARDLTASAKLKEAQTSLMVVDLLKSQIKELEEQINKVRHDFFQYCVDHSQNNWGGASKTTNLVNQYTQQATARAQLTMGAIRSTWHERTDKKGEYRWHGEELEQLNIPGLNTPEDLFRLYQFITQPQLYDQTAYQLALVLQPITQIWPELQEKKQQLKKAMDSLVG